MDGTQNGLKNQTLLTVLFHCRAKPGCEAKMRVLVSDMTRVSRQDDGCLTYDFHQQKDDPQQWMLHERWRDRAALEGHVRSMKQHFGEPPPGARLPARLHELTESSSAVFYCPPIP